jgi:hypothetical protein
LSPSSSSTAAAASSSSGVFDGFQRVRV